MSKKIKVKTKKPKTAKPKPKAKEPVKTEGSKSMATASASGVSQIVNVRVGDTQVPKKPVAKKPSRPSGGGGGGMAGLAMFDRSVPQLLLNPQPAMASVNSSYNELLRQLTEERKQRLSMLKPLEPNTTGLTTNKQTNELLSVKEPFSNAIKSALDEFNKTQDLVIDEQLYDDPFTNDNMFLGSSRLAENIAPRLSLTPFDMEDIENYDLENQNEQQALENLVEERRDEEELGLTRDQRKKKEIRTFYDEYVIFVDNVNAQYGLTIVPKAIRKINSKKRIQDEIDRIKERIRNLQN